MTSQRTGSYPEIDLRSTGAFDSAGSLLQGRSAEASALYDDVVEGLAVPAMVLDAAGIALSANVACCELLQRESQAILGEPFLTWIGRPSERESFGREFVALRRRNSGHAFAREVAVTAALGPPVRCNVRVGKLQSGSCLLTCQPVAENASLDGDFGRAVTRALDALDQGVLLVDGEGRIVHANPYARTLLGPGVLGRGFAELAAPSEVERFTKALALARAGAWHAELEISRLDSTRLPVELSIAAGSGAGAPAVVLFRDLREQRRREFDERLMAQVDRALLSSIEPRDSVTAACRALAAGLGASHVAIVTHLGGGWERWEITSDRGTRVTRLDAGVRPPAEWSEDTSPQRWSGHDPDDPACTALFGSTDPNAEVVRWLLRAPGGVVGHMAAVFGRGAEVGEREIALGAQVATQLAMGLANGLLMLETRALAAYQGRLLDQTTVMLNSVDEIGRIRTWNRASEAVFGARAVDVVGRRFGVEVARAVEPARWQELWNELHERGFVTAELALTDADGAPLPVHLEGRLLREGRATTGAVFVALDLRSRKALETQVLRTQKLAAVGLLAAGIAHEINNPLSGVVGYSKLLLEKPLPHDVRERVERIAASGERCRKIVEGVLLFSRQQGGARRRTELTDLVDRVVGIGEYQWKMHNVRVVKEMPAPVEVMCDPEQIEQVLLNLLSNAVDAMPRGGTVTVRLHGDEGGARLEVSDHGSGIPAEIQASIFDPFFSTKEIGKGTGLGLAISYGIVRDHGGDILVESSPGAGTTFTVLIPTDGAPPANARGEVAFSAL